MPGSGLGCCAFSAKTTEGRSRWIWDIGWGLTGILSARPQVVTGQVPIGRRVADHVVAGIYSSLRESQSHAIPASLTWIRSWFERAPTKIE